MSPSSPVGQSEKGLDENHDWPGLYPAWLSGGGADISCFDDWF